MGDGARPATQVLTRPDGTAVELVQRATLAVIKGPDKGQSVDLGGDPIVCGGDPSCDLVLTDSSISSRHIEVRPTPQGFRVADLGSTNGTFVEGVRIDACWVEGRANIRVGRSRLRLTPSRDQVEIPLSSRDRFGLLLGSSVTMRRTFAMLERVAAVDATVLIEGESGTGKELAARSIHQSSARASGPFVVVDCGAIPEQLVEAELFGHERGAFTGADRARTGYFEAADGGTLLLDEVGELPASMQPRLLRVLEQRQITRVGATAPISIDVRLLAATNRELAAEVEAGRFREDLYYRLAVLRIVLPPLRERREDIRLLADHFVDTLTPALEGERRLSPENMAMLNRHDWPGNVRELKNVVERLLVLPELGAAAIQSSCDDDDGGSGLGPLLQLPFHEARTRWTERFERAYLEAKLAEAEGVVLRAAEQAQIPRQTFHRLMKKLGLGS